MDRAYLLLETGRIFEGNPQGASGERTGEIVFNTSMTGYQEILTDPSYCGQIVCMTYPCFLRTTSYMLEPLYAIGRLRR